MNARDLKALAHRQAVQEAENLALMFKVGAAAIILAGVCYLVPNLTKAAEVQQERVQKTEAAWEEFFPTNPTK